MNQNQTDATRRRRTDTRSKPPRTDDRGRRIPTPAVETDAPLVPDLGRPSQADTDTYHPDPLGRMLMRDAE